MISFNLSWQWNSKTQGADRYKWPVTCQVLGTCIYYLADAFIQSNLQLIRQSRRHAPWSNVGLRAQQLCRSYLGHTKDRTTGLVGPSPFVWFQFAEADSAVFALCPDGSATLPSLFYGSAASRSVPLLWLSGALSFFLSRLLLQCGHQA